MIAGNGWNFIGQVIGLNELLYDALILGRNKNVAREEYLVARGEKKAAVFAAKEQNISFSDVLNDAAGIIHLQLSAAGYAEIEAYSDSVFISFDKKVFTTDEFIDNGYQFFFTVISDALHNGKNFGRIIFRTPICSCSVDIVVHNHVKVGYADINRRALMAALCNDYIELRLGNLFQTEWQRKTLDLLDNVSGSDVPDLYLALYRANVLISADRREEARNLIEFAAEQMQKLDHIDWELLCYIRYIGSLYEMKEVTTSDTLEQIREVYKLHPSWRILWILFYMDAEMSDSPAEMFDGIEKEFLLRGCRSPLMYFEAMDCLIKEPGLIKAPSGFITQVLSFAAKHDYLTAEVCSRLSNAVWECDDDTIRHADPEALIRVFQSALGKYDNNLILKCLCKTLIAAGKKDNEYHVYYSRAIDEFLETDNIYDYFIASADKEKFIHLPDAVVEHFTGREYSLKENKEYYYACLIKEKDSHLEACERSIVSIGRHAEEMIILGRVNPSLAVIYQEMMSQDRMPHDRYQRMIEVLNTREIRTDNKLVVSALVFHREFNEYQESILENGRALVKIYSADAVILFKDVAGNLYHNIDFELKQIMDRSEYLDICIRNSLINRYMLIGDNLAMLRVVKDPENILDYLYKNIGKGQLRASYEKELLSTQIMHICRSAQEDRSYTDLLKFLKFNLDTPTRAKLIEIMIDKKKYREVYGEIEKHGFEGVDADRIRELTHILAGVTDLEEDKVMTEMAEYAFINSRFDQIVFDYMCMHYDDRLDVLMKMYAASCIYGDENIEVAERVVRKMLHLNDFPYEGVNAFKKYYGDGEDNELKLQFITAVAGRYLETEQMEYGYIFEYAEKLMYSGTKLDDKVVAAFLLYMRLKSGHEPRTLKLLEELLKKLTAKSIMLEEFKDYKRFFKLPAVLSNTFIVSCRGQVQETPGEENGLTAHGYTANPVISYEISSRDGVVSNREMMREILDGCYAKYFTLFYGEMLKYRINNGSENVVAYGDLDTVDDASRYARINRMIKMTYGQDKSAAASAAREYFINDAVIGKLF